MKNFCPRIEIFVSGKRLYNTSSVSVMVRIALSDPFACVFRCLVVREAFENLCKEFQLEILFAPLEYCSDNAAMIGRAAIEPFSRGNFISMSDLKAHPKSPL